MYGRTLTSIWFANRFVFQHKSVTCHLPKLCHHEAIRQSLNESDVNHHDTKEEKLLKVAVIGLPNVGKSTLVNQLVKRRVSKSF